jgi:hypothetical protein
MREKDVAGASGPRRRVRIRGNRNIRNRIEERGLRRRLFFLVLFPGTTANRAPGKADERTARLASSLLPGRCSFL